MSEEDPTNSKKSETYSDSDLHNDPDFHFSKNKEILDDLYEKKKKFEERLNQVDLSPKQISSIKNALERIKEAIAGIEDENEAIIPNPKGGRKHRKTGKSRKTRKSKKHSKKTRKHRK